MKIKPLRRDTWKCAFLLSDGTLERLESKGGNDPREAAHCFVHNYTVTAETEDIEIRWDVAVQLSGGLWAVYGVGMDYDGVAEYQFLELYESTLDIGELA